MVGKGKNEVFFFFLFLVLLFLVLLSLESKKGARRSLVPARGLFSLERKKEKQRSAQKLPPVSRLFPVFAEVEKNRKF